MYDQKNIRRRVYDALNVLMAMNIISKEKKEIKWIGLPTNSAQECQNLEVGAGHANLQSHQHLHMHRVSALPATFSSLYLLLFSIGGKTKEAGEDQTETITASGTHTAGRNELVGAVNLYKK